MIIVQFTTNIYTKVINKYKYMYNIIVLKPYNCTNHLYTAYNNYYFKIKII